MNTMTFKLSGLHCASCKVLIEEVVHDVPSVESANVDIKNETLTIEHGDTFDPRLLTDAVTGLGAGYAIRKL